MKRKKSLQVVMLVFALGASVVSAQEGARDPFTRDPSGRSSGEAAGTESNIILELQFIELAMDDVLQAEQEGVADGEWRRFAAEKLEKGSARYVDSVAMLARSGQRTKVASKLDLMVPREREQLEIDPEGPVFPKSMASEETGLIFEVDPIIGEKREVVFLSYALNFSRHLGETDGARIVSERLQETDVMFPAYWKQKVTSQASFPIGKSTVLTKLESWEANADRLILVFFRCDLLDIDSVLPPEVVAAAKTLKLRSSVFEIDSELWHDWISSSDLSAFFGGGAWDRITEARANTPEKLSIVSVPKFEVVSANRAKVHMGVQIEYPSAYSHPEAIGGRAVPSEFRKKELGTVWEADSVKDGNTGRIHVNQNLEVLAVRGHSVSYRALVDDVWQPSIRFPKIFSTSYTGQCVIGPEANLLVAVTTPSTEEGNLESGKKRLYFLHNDTYETP